MRKLALLFMMAALFLVACSEKQEPTKVKTHPSDWLQVHGTALLDSSLSQVSCQECHGVNFAGGTSGISCYSCHSYPHPAQWADSNAANFHGPIAKKEGNTKCQACHGADFSGGSSGVSCYQCHTYPHREAWQDMDSTGFHGQVVLAQGEENCQACHGTKYGGGTSGISCYDCHTFPHPDGFGDAQSSNFHKSFFRTINWKLAECQACHGTDFAGGRVNVSCTTCHTQPAGPEACNTCHGDFTNPAQIAPPEDLSGNLDHTAVGVGAHQHHLEENDVTVPLSCGTCHPAITDFNDPRHIDNVPGAQMEFDTQATDSGRLQPLWNHSSATCSNVYCHGNFVFSRDSSANQWAYADSVIVGKSDPVVWTSEMVPADSCSFCHDLPPQGHANFGTSVTVCVTCHSSVVDGNGKIIDKTRHINGKPDL